MQPLITDMHYYACNTPRLQSKGLRSFICSTVRVIVLELLLGTRDLNPGYPPPEIHIL